MKYHIPNGKGAFKVALKYLVDYEKLPLLEAVEQLRGKEKMKQLKDSLSLVEIVRHFREAIKDTPLRISEARNILGIKDAD